MKRPRRGIWFPGWTLNAQTVRTKHGPSYRRADVCFHPRVKLRTALRLICFSISLSTSISAAALQWRNTTNVAGRNATSETLQRLVANTGSGFKKSVSNWTLLFPLCLNSTIIFFPLKRVVVRNRKSPKFFPSALPLPGSYIYTYWTLLSFFILVGCIIPHAVCLPLAASHSLSRWVLRWDDLLR